MSKNMVHIFATDADGLVEEITDLYWFEEHGVHDFGGKGHFGQYHLEVIVNKKPCLVCPACLRAGDNFCSVCGRKLKK